MSSNGKKHPTSKKTARKATQEARAVALRAEGKSFGEIGDALGVKRQWAHMLVLRGVSRVVSQEDADQVRTRIMRQLGEMMESIQPDLEAGQRWDPDLVEAACKVIDRMAKIHGLYVQKHEVRTDTLPALIEALNSTPVLDAERRLLEEVEHVRSNGNGNGHHS